jgi:hypothetical protein
VAEKTSGNARGYFPSKTRVNDPLQGGFTLFGYIGTVDLGPGEFTGEDIAHEIPHETIQVLRRVSRHGRRGSRTSFARVEVLDLAPRSPSAAALASSSEPLPSSSSSSSGVAGRTGRLPWARPRFCGACLAPPLAGVERPLDRRDEATEPSYAQSA